MNVYHVINRNKFAKPKIVIENVVSPIFFYYYIKNINQISFLNWYLLQLCSNCVYEILR